ncbi:MAG TPA: energy coupling factor transporter S component ThiW [Sporolactobacillaceae bacterium]|nr:energy coupling factor transporter S component ThiW [Sporolactobacillaceae bacterium]
MRKTQQLCFSALLIALGVIAGNLIYIPIGVSKCFPVQAFINVVSAVFLGPWYAVSNAFLISLLRVMFGTGSFLAFPGSMIGAFLAGLLFRKTKIIIFSALGEVFGTGLVAALVAVPLVKLVYGTQAAAFFFVVPFLLSTCSGSLISVIVLSSVKKHPIVGRVLEKKSA